MHGVRVHQPGSHLTRGGRAQVEDWSWGQTKRRLQALYRLARPYKGRTAIAIGSLLAATAVALLPPYLLGRTIDESGTAEHRHTRLARRRLHRGGRARHRLQLPADLLHGLDRRADARRPAGQLFGHLQRLSLGFYERNRAGVIISRLTNDVEALDQLVTDGVTTLVQNTLLLVGTAVVLFFLDWRLALAALIVMPVMAVLTAWFRKRSGRAYRGVRETLGAVTATLAEDIAGMRVLQSFTRERAAQENFRQVSDRYRESNMQTVVLSRDLLPGRRLHLVGRDRGRARLRQLSRVQRRDDDRRPGRVPRVPDELLRSGAAALAALQHVPVGRRGARQDHRPAGRGAGGARRRGRGRARPHRRSTSIFDDVRFAYGRGPEVLHGIHLEVPAGTTVALVGHTGAGKSTIAKLLARFYDPTGGAIRIDGVDLRTVSHASLRRQLGIVPQEGFLFAGTVAENIAFGRPDAEREEIVAAARAVGADEFIERLEDGYDTQLGERGSRLSLGQRQLVAFARALLADPRILILDEATSSVDIGTERKIERALRRLLHGRTAFIIAHRLSTIRDADLIVVLEHGQVVEQGTHDELLASPRPLHVALRRLGRERRLTPPIGPSAKAYRVLA